MNAKAERVGIYGGTFNPVHHGHLLVARDAMEALALDRLLFLPNARSPLRQGEKLAPAADRLAMLRLALEGEPRCDVCELETERGGTSYTVETLRSLRGTHPNGILFFLMGADSLETFDRWVAPEEIVHLAQVVALPRPGFDAAKALAELFRRAPNLTEKVSLLPEGRHIDISATEIRQRAREGKSLRWLVPDGVAEYVKRKGLYGRSDE
jgi:nicotinate-nucleotide adenylyltransferase